MNHKRTRNRLDISSTERVLALQQEQRQKSTSVSSRAKQLIASQPPNSNSTKQQDNREGGEGVCCYVRPDVEGLVVDGEGGEQHLRERPLAAVVPQDVLVVPQVPRQRPVLHQPVPLLLPLPPLPVLPRGRLRLPQPSRPSIAKGREDESRAEPGRGYATLLEYSPGWAREDTPVVSLALASIRFSPWVTSARVSGPRSL